MYDRKHHLSSADAPDPSNQWNVTAMFGTQVPPLELGAAPKHLPHEKGIIPNLEIILKSS